MGEEYTLEEVYADGYYLNEPIVLEVNRNNDEYELTIIEGNTKSNSVIIENEIPVANLEIENLKISSNQK